MLGMCQNPVPYYPEDSEENRKMKARYKRDVFEDLCTAIGWVGELDKKIQTLHPDVAHRVRQLIA